MPSHLQPIAQRLQTSRGSATLRALAVSLGLLSAAAVWAGPTVIYVATDLADTTAGEDLWRYDYTVSGPIDSFGAVNLFFSSSLYANLFSSTLDSNQGLAADVQPDVALPADGIVSSTFFAGLLDPDTASLSVEFVWLGGATATPEAQAFSVFDGNGGDAGSGRTVAAGTPPNGLPEPSPASLVAAAMVASALVRRFVVRA